jgi:hypothetical protein
MVSLDGEADDVIAELDVPDAVEVVVVGGSIVESGRRDCFRFRDGSAACSGEWFRSCCSSSTVIGGVGLRSCSRIFGRAVCRSSGDQRK